MKTTLHFVCVLLLIVGVANAVPSNYNALSKQERKARQTRCIMPREHTPVSFDLVQMGEDGDHLAIKVDGEFKYVEKKGFYPKYHNSMVADIDKNGLDDLLFEYWPGTQGLGLGCGIAVYFQQKNGDFKKFIVPAERFSPNDIFDIDGDGIFEIVTAQLGKYREHNYWLYCCWRVRPHGIMNADAEFDFPRAILFTSKPNQQLADKETTRNIYGYHGYQGRPFSYQTLRQVLRHINIGTEAIETSNIDRSITNYAVLNEPKIFCIGYYLAGYSDCVDSDLCIDLFKKDQKKWIHNELELGALVPDKPHFRPGSVVRIARSGKNIYLITHKTPSAGCTLILSGELGFQHVLYGQLLATFDDGTVVYHNGQVHFAPTHCAEISVYNPHTKRDRKIYPMKPYHKIRLAHIEGVKAAYDKLGKDWFRCHNHHMNPELFNNSLKGKVAVNNSTDSLAFVILYDNRDCWSEEDKLKLQSFRELQRSLAKVNVTAPLPDYFFSYLSSDLGRIRRLNTQDLVPKLFRNHKELQNMFQKALKSERQPGQHPKKYFLSLDDNWTNPETWKKILDTIKVPPEYTEVAYIFQNIRKDNAIRYKEVLLSDLTGRYGDIPISKCLEPELLKQMFEG